MTQPLKNSLPLFILVALILTILATLTLPLSPDAMDFMLAGNLVMTVIILVLSVAVSDTLKIFSFPSLLFVMTLFRLSLNIASTRLILTEGEAGSIISAFGMVLSNGNIMVGLISFLVLQITQFMIIAKGSERVAEVAARFALDALPGRQMSIDSDLRAGLSTAEDAQIRRNRLMLESKFFGAMDGAMKFVKGETVAGFIIVFINLVGGIGIGVMTHGYTLTRALQHFALLSMGDGLVAQIPSLMLAMATGFLITRVSKEENSLSLGNELMRQLLQHPHILLATGFFCLLMMAFCDLTKTMLGFGTLLIGTTFILKFHSYREKNSSSALSVHIIEHNKKSSSDLPEPLLVEINPEWLDKRNLKVWLDFFKYLFPRFKAVLEDRTGLALPDLKLVLLADTAKAFCRVRIHEIPVFEGKIKHNTLDLFQQELLKQLARSVSQHAEEFLGLQEVKNRLDKLKATHADLINEVVPRQISLIKLTDILKRLLSEGLSIRDLRLILEILAQIQPDQKDPIMLTEELRMAMKRQLTHLFSQNDAITAFLVDPEIEEEIIQNVAQENGEYFLKMAPERIKKICRTIKQSFLQHKARASDTVILTRPEVRRYLKRLIETELPEIAVVSFSELDPNIKVNCRDTIGVSQQDLPSTLKETTCSHPHYAC